MRIPVFTPMLALSLLFYTDATAQFDLEEIMQNDTPAVSDDSETLAQAQKESLADTEVTDEIAETVILPEDETDNNNLSDTANDSAEETADNTSENAPEDTDDFMVQYFNDVDEAAAEDAANQAAREAASELIRDEPTMITLPEEQQKLLKISERRRQQRAEKRRQELEEQKRLQAEILAKQQAEEKAKAEAEAAEAEAKALKDPKIMAARKAEAERLAKEKMLSTHEKAPFGLYWGLSKEQTESLGFRFKPAILENNQNVYALINPQQQQKQFEPIFVIFGDRDHLHSVYAEGIYTKDTPQAEKVLRLYNQYYAALKKKYGNDKEFFKPNTHQEKVAPPAAIQQTEHTAAPIEPKIVSVDHPRGNDNFLKELQEEKASLYAIFGNQKIRVTLSIEVNEQAQSHIVLDYENLETQQSDNSETFNDLVNEL